MATKQIKIDVVTRPNCMITVVGRDMGAISATNVESLIDYALPEAQLIISNARNEGKYRQFITDESKIKSLIIMTNGIVYPSSFRVVTLNERIKEATSELDNSIEKANQ